MEQRVSGVAHVDLAVARRIVAGDEAEFRALFDHYFPRLYRFALARLDGDHDAARDIVQQTFCRAIEQLGSYRGEAALFTWFYQICRNTLMDYYRYTSRRARIVVPLEDQPDIRAVLETLGGAARRATRDAGLAFGRSQARPGHRRRAA